jgi:hypothetical protein
MEDAVWFLEFFAGRSDAYARQEDDGSWRPVHATIGAEQVFEMSRGDATYGFYTVRADGLTRVLVFDIDTGDFTDVERIQDTLELLGIRHNQMWTEFSGRKGWHVWLFLERWTEAEVAYKAVRGVLRVAGMEGTEAWPKQRRVSDLNRGLGNLIKFPLTIHRVSGKRSHSVPKGYTWYRERVTTTQLLYLADEYVEWSPGPAAEQPAEGWLKELPCMLRIATTGVGVGMRDDSMFSYALNCKRKQMSEADALTACREANMTFQPPMTDVEVVTKVRSAYASAHSGFDCASPHLHRKETLLCSRKCPRYPAIEGMPATDDAPLGSAGGGGGVKPEPGILPTVGEELSLTVKRTYRRADGLPVVVLSYPGADDATVVLREETV